MTRTPLSGSPAVGSCSGTKRPRLGPPRADGPGKGDCSSLVVADRRPCCSGQCASPDRSSEYGRDGLRPRVHNARAGIDGLAPSIGRTAMKLPSHFYERLALGAPEPVRELPVRPERSVHFFPPHLERVRAKVPALAAQVDVLCGNLEDAIPADAKDAARAGLIEVVNNTDLGGTALWVRVNALNSPWFLDDLTEVVTGIGDRLDVVMIPKVEGPWDIHFVDQLLALLEARAGLTRPILVHALLETAQGVKNVDDIAVASPRMHGMSLGPADLAASRGMKTTRVGGGHPFYGVLADDPDETGRRAFAQQDLWHYTIARMVDACPV